MNNNKNSVRIVIKSKHLRSVLEKVGVGKAHHLVFHASYRKIRSAFPGLTIKNLLETLQNLLTPAGSLIIPTFTYCFKKKSGSSKIYSPELTASEVGAVSECFRQMPEVIRTSSPTHSFALWGKVSLEILFDNCPVSPLGNGSVLEWITHQPQSYILCMGTDFSTMSYCHYLEIQARVPWADVFPWDFMGIEKKGISITGEQNLIEVPGCSKSFINFEKYLLQNNFISSYQHSHLSIYYIPVKLLYEQGMIYFKENYSDLLCEPGKCHACDVRR